jgi:hypothetical protein
MTEQKKERLNRWHGYWRKGNLSKTVYPKFGENARLI